MIRVRRGLATFLFLVVVIVAALVPFPRDAQARLSGGNTLFSAMGGFNDVFGDGPSGGTEAGCNCHRQQKDASVTPSLTLSPAIPVGEEYLPNETYMVNVSIQGGPAPGGAGSPQGGFLLVADKGSFSLAEGWESYTFVSQDGRMVAHTEPGARAGRSWTVLWTAPTNGSGDVWFRLVVNSVNGDETFSEVDAWNDIWVKVEGYGWEGGEYESFLAHWGLYLAIAAIGTAVSLAIILGFFYRWKG